VGLGAAASVGDERGEVEVGVFEGKGETDGADGGGDFEGVADPVEFGACAGEGLEWVAAELAGGGVILGNVADGGGGGGGGGGAAKVAVEGRGARGRVGGEAAGVGVGRWRDGGGGGVGGRRRGCRTGQGRRGEVGGRVGQGVRPGGGEERAADGCDGVEVAVEVGVEDFLACHVRVVPGGVVDGVEGPDGLYQGRHAEELGGSEGGCVV